MPLEHIQSAQDARLHASRRLPAMIFDFIDGAAGEERAVRRNLQALSELNLMPRELVKVEDRITERSLLGRTWGLPFGIAPMGMCALSWPRADEAMADVAKTFNIPHCLSTAASMSIERCTELAGDNVWFQLYLTDETVGMALVDRALAAGVTHLILTVDTPLISKRRRELRRGFKVPFKMGPKQLFDFATHPRWSIATLMAGAPKFGNNDPTKAKGDQAFDRSKSRGGVDFEFLKRLRDKWPHRLIVKGILNPDDALAIKACGVDAIYVSNHGGRQLDSAPAAISMLPGIRGAVGPDYPLIFDSGIRDGEDIVKALALGADFVMVGRPYLYAAGAAGSQGVVHLTELIQQELHAALAQIGRRDVNELDGSVFALTS